MFDSQKTKTFAVMVSLWMVMTTVAWGQSTAFTYQGRFSDGATAANGNYDFEFRLFDSVSGGTQQGSTVQRLNVAVANGIFTVQLDFGANFPGADRFLDISVRAAGAASFTALAPRQSIASTPYAIRSSSAATADNATQLSGVAASQYVQTTDARLTDARTPTAGSTNYIQNGSAVQASANFNISGSGAVGGNLGVGTVMPEYKLDVVHGGNTGIRNKASNGFSVIDIDSAPNGDAALRFMKNGAFRWNIRNRSFDDSLEFFEMGGGGSRMILQNATGNVGIGDLTPLSRLHLVDNGGNFQVGGGGCGAGFVGFGFGATLAACGNYSMVGNGTDTIINRPTGGRIFFRENNTTQMSIAAGGNVTINGNLSKGGGSFKIDHPLDPENKYLSHSFVESPDMMNIYNGVVTLGEFGAAEVPLPEWFEALNRDYRYQLTPIGMPGPNLYIAEEVKDNHFKIAGGTPGQKVSWQVTGIRKDAYANKNRIPVEEAKPEEERGTYLHPEAFGQPKEKAFDAKLRAQTMERNSTQASNEVKAVEKPVAGNALDSTMEFRVMPPTKPVMRKQ